MTYCPQPPSMICGAGYAQTYEVVTFQQNPMTKSAFWKRENHLRPSNLW